MRPFANNKLEAKISRGGDALHRWLLAWRQGDVSGAPSASVEGATMAGHVATLCKKAAPLRIGVLPVVARAADAARKAPTPEDLSQERKHHRPHTRRKKGCPMANGGARETVLICPRGARTVLTMPLLLWLLGPLYLPLGAAGAEVLALRDRVLDQGAPRRPQVLAGGAATAAARAGRP